jgi:hypothetical protein
MSTAEERMQSAIEELEQENRLLRARNNRLEAKQWLGLDDDEIVRVYETTGHYQTLRPQDRFAMFKFTREIEIQLKQKNS